MLKSAFLTIVVLAFAQTAQAGYATSYRGVADCGWAQDWPRETSTQIFNQNCNVTLTLSPDGRNRSGQIEGSMEWIVSDMVFTGTYIQSGSQLYLDFHGKRYSNYRGAKIFNGIRTTFIEIPSGRRGAIRLFPAN